MTISGQIFQVKNDENFAISFIKIIIKLKNIIYASNNNTNLLFFM